MSKNLCAKTRKIEDPYEIWEGSNGWKWLVLKKYQTPEKEVGNPFARWFCAVSSPLTYGEYEYGDTYVDDITRYAVRVK